MDFGKQYPAWSRCESESCNCTQVNRRRLMKHVRIAIWIHVVSIVLVLSAEQASARDRVRLWYDKPASKWTEAVPLGNGRLGAMVFGTAPKERLQLNEESLWAGKPTDVYPEDFSENFRSYLAAGPARPGTFTDAMPAALRSGSVLWPDVAEKPAKPQPCHPKAAVKRPR